MKLEILSPVCDERSADARGWDAAAGWFTVVWDGRDVMGSRSRWRVSLRMTATQTGGPILFEALEPRRWNAKFLGWNRCPWSRIKILYEPEKKKLAPQPCDRGARCAVPSPRGARFGGRAPHSASRPAQ